MVARPTKVYQNLSGLLAERLYSVYANGAPPRGWPTVVHSLYATLALQWLQGPLNFSTLIDVLRCLVGNINT